MSEEANRQFEIAADDLKYALEEYESAYQKAEKEAQRIWSYGPSVVKTAPQRERERLFSRWSNDFSSKVKHSGRLLNETLMNLYLTANSPDGTWAEFPSDAGDDGNPIPMSDIRKIEYLKKYNYLDRKNSSENESIANAMQKVRKISNAGGGHVLSEREKQAGFADPWKVIFDLKKGDIVQIREMNQCLTIIVEHFVSTAQKSLIDARNKRTGPDLDVTFNWPDDEEPAGEKQAKKDKKRTDKQNTTETSEKESAAQNDYKAVKGQDIQSSHDTTVADKKKTKSLRWIVVIILFVVLSYVVSPFAIRALSDRTNMEAMAVANIGETEKNVTEFSAVSGDTIIEAINGKSSDTDIAAFSNGILKAKNAGECFATMLIPDRTKGYGQYLPQLITALIEGGLKTYHISVINPESTQTETDANTEQNSSSQETSQSTPRQENEKVYVGETLAGTATAASNLNIRTGPGTEYSVVSTVAAGTTLELTGEEQNGWTKVRTQDGTEGWVSTGYLNLSSTASIEDTDDNANYSENDAIYSQYKDIIDYAISNYTEDPLTVLSLSVGNNIRPDAAIWTSKICYSSDPSVASINDSGTVTGVSRGIAYIIIIDKTSVESYFYHSPANVQQKTYVVIVS